MALQRTGSRSGNRGRLVPGLLVALAIASFQLAISRGVFVYGDDVLMYEVAASIARGRGLEVTSPSDDGDVARSIPGIDGRQYAKYGIGLSIVAAPFSMLGDSPLIQGLALPETVDRVGNPRAGASVFAAGLANVAVAGVLALVLFLLCLELGYGVRAALAVSLVAGLATPFPHYAAGFLSEPLSALCLALGVLGLAMSDGAHERPTSSELGGLGRATGGATAAPWAGPLVGGLAGGFALLTRPLHLLCVVPLGVWMGWFALAAPRSSRASRWNGFLLFALLVAIATAAIGLANFTRFGSIFETGYGGEARRFETPLFEGLLGQILSPGKGVLWYCPAVILGLAGARGFWRRAPRVASAILTGSLLLVLVTSKYYQWHGGGSWGPRFLVPLLPLWLLPAAEAFSEWSNGAVWRRALGVLLIGLSLIAAMLPVLVPFDRHVIDVNSESGHFEASTWTWRKSPLVLAAAEAPEALAQAAAKLLGTAPLEATHLEPGRLHAPDAAFVRYGSHALLQWARGGLALALFTLAGAVFCVWRPRSD